MCYYLYEIKEIHSCKRDCRGGKKMWESLFEQYILERGFEYYLSKKVKNIKQTTFKISAQVMGTHLYEVEINCLNERVKDMFCSCPYFASGHNCKHLAATLYKVDKDAVKRMQTKIKRDEELPLETETQSIASTVDKVSMDELRDFLITSFASDAELYNSFLKFTNQKEVDINAIKNNIIEILAECSDDEFYYYDDEDEYDILLGLEDFLTDSVTDLLKLKREKAAFNLTIFTLTEAGKCDSDVLDSILDIVVDASSRLWTDIFQQSSKIFRKEIFNVLISENEMQDNRYLLTCTIDFLIENYKQRDYLDKLIEYCEKILKGNLDDDGWGFYREEREHLFDQIVTLLRANETEEDEIKEFCKKYWKLSEARKCFAKISINQGDYVKAIEVLEESKIKDSDYPIEVWQCNVMLKDIYKSINHQKYILKLTELIIQVPSQLDLYKELRTQYSHEEWKKQYLPRLIKNIHNKAGVEKIFKEEGMKSELMSLIEAKNSFYLLEKYEDFLKTTCVKEILAMYTKKLIEDAQIASNRKEYQQIALQLQHMKLFKGGNQAVTTLIKQWQIKYARRRAMMEELSKI